MSETTSETVDNAKSLSMIVTKGSLDWAYPPIILATTAATYMETAMKSEINLFI